MFAVTLTATHTVTSESDTATANVRVAFPAAQIGGSAVGGFGCAPLTVSFTDASTVNGPDTINAWNWSFGDGNTSNQQNPTHTYQEYGIYTVSLTTSTAIVGASDTDTNAAYIQVIGPNVDFSATPGSGAQPLSVSFSDLTAFATPLVSWTWNFGDGGASNQQNPTHIYTDVGSYQVSLSVTDVDGCSRTLTRTAFVTVAPGPAAILGVSSGSGQSTPSSAAFANALVATVTDSSGNPVPGESVTFTAPATGASGTFASTGTTTETVITDVNGRATSSVFTANTAAGDYAVTASSGTLTPVNLSLANSGSPMAVPLLSSLQLWLLTGLLTLFGFYSSWRRDRRAGV